MLFAPVILSEYNDAWPAQFGVLSTALRNALGDLCTSVEHVGSTAVPGMPAKPVIDLDLVIALEEHLPLACEKLARLGYACQGDLGIAGRWAFRRETGAVPRDGSRREWPEHHLYVCPRDSAELARHLAFRDHLRGNGAAAASYANLKRELVQLYTNDRDAYTAGKSAFVRSVLQQAEPDPAGYNTQSLVEGLGGMSDIETLRIRQIGAAHVGARVRVRGWLSNKPGGKGRCFLWLRDGSGTIQAVTEQAALPAATWADVERIGLESSVIVEGVVRTHPKQAGVYELGLTGLIVVQCVGAQGEFGEYPIGKKEHGVEFLMHNRHLWIRGKRQSAILRIRSEVHKAWADFFYERGFYRVDTPIFTPNACEGTTTLFEVDYHGTAAYLAQSGQLYNEADIGALGQVYCFGPTFRAEKSKTRRHLLEFWMLEMEAAFYEFDPPPETGIPSLLRFQEEMLAYTVKRILGNCLSDLRDLERDPQKLEPATETPYPRVRYGETIGICNKWRLEKVHEVAPELLPKGPISGSPDEVNRVVGELWEQIGASHVTYSDSSIEDSEESKRSIQKFRWGDDYGAPDEAEIGANYDRPVFVTNFPIEVKGFYFKDELGADGQPVIDPAFARLKASTPHLIAEDADGNMPSGHTVLGADCIGPESAGEIIGGSQREDDYSRLLEKIHRHNLPEQYFQWYLDTRRYGNVPHSGFGLGLERFLCWVCGGSDNPVHIREAITYPRMLHQLEP